MLEDINGQESEEEGNEELELWKLLPQLRELPASMVKKLPMSAMFHLNAALSKETGTTGKTSSILQGSWGARAAPLPSSGWRPDGSLERLELLPWATTTSTPSAAAAA